MDSRGNWWVSDYNLDPKVTSKFNLARQEAIISDCTLREGDQQAGVNFDPNDKVELAREMDEIGIQEIEPGNPFTSDAEKTALREIVKRKVDARIMALCTSGGKQSIDLALDCDVDGVIIPGIQVGKPQRLYVTKIPDDEAISRAVELALYAKSHGLYVVYGATDTTRAELDLLRRVYTAGVNEAHVDVIRVSDTVGAITPQGMDYLIRNLKQTVGDVPIQVHCHDDFGLATANTLAAYTAGASVLSTSFHGLGQHAGNAPTEEVILALQVLYGVDIHIQTEKLHALSKLIESKSGVKNQPQKAVVGDNIFVYDSGTMISRVMRFPLAGSSYLPEIVGQMRRVVLGKYCNNDSVLYKLNEMSLKASDDEIRRVVSEIQKETSGGKPYVSDQEFKDIVRRMKET